MTKLEDFSPLFRSSIGFDRIFDMLESATQSQGLESWPPYDIVRISEDAYRVSMAVAGFTQDELKVTHSANLLTVSGKKADGGEGEYLYRGIIGREFERRFELADYVRVAGANLDNGLLTIDLVREVPEEMKPRRIEIRSDMSRRPEARQLESRKHAA